MRISSAGTPQWAATSSGANPAASCANVVDTVDVVGHSPEIRCDKALFEEHVHDGEQQRGVGARADGEVPIGQFGGAGAGRIDDGEPAAALAQRPQLAGEVGGGGQTPVGHKGIRADDHQVVGVVEVGHRERDRAAEHVAERDVLGHLVQRAGAEHLMGAERADDQRRVQAARDGVGVRVAEVDPDRRAAVLTDDRAEAFRDDGERLVPRRLGQDAVATDQRPRQPVGVVVEFGEARALRADEALAEHVVVVAAGAGDPAVGDGQRQAAGGLAERADPQGCLRSSTRSCADYCCSYTLGSSVPM